MLSINDIIAAEESDEVERFAAMTHHQLMAEGEDILAEDQPRRRFLWDQECRRRLMDRAAFNS